MLSKSQFHVAKEKPRCRSAGELHALFWRTCLAFGDAHMESGLREPANEQREDPRTLKKKSFGRSIASCPKEGLLLRSKSSRADEAKLPQNLVYP